MVIRTFPQSYPDEWGSNGDSERAAGARSAATTPRAGGSGRPLTAVVLAAGEGTRMRSARPKPLHRLCGRPMVLHVLDALAELSVTRVVVVVGHRAEWVTKTLIEHAPTGMAIEFVEQVEQRGTGDAMSVALTGLPDDEGDEESDVVVLPGDTPLLRPATLARLVRHHRESEAAATLLTAEIDKPAGYGRVVRGRNDSVARVVEQSDATEEELEVKEVNTSIYCFRRSVLAPSLRRLSPANAQGEYYLTDVVGVLYDAGHNVGSMVVADTMEVAGVNDRAQLAVAEAELRDRINERWMRRGVTMWDPECTYIDADVRLGTDVVLLPGVILQGACEIDEHAEIGPNAHLVDTKVGEGAVVTASVCRRSVIGHDARVGPFAVLLEGSEVAAGSVVGAAGSVVGATGAVGLSSDLSSDLSMGAGLDTDEAADGLDSAR
jgi:bifunctional UDP-N-acetylglucosamine pyrophosphorylase/glucosamine-1-phosphate N-acetyltransferase